MRIRGSHARTAPDAAGCWLKQQIEPRWSAPGPLGRVGWTLLLSDATPFVGLIGAAMIFMGGLGPSAATTLDGVRASVQFLLRTCLGSCLPREHAAKAVQRDRKKHGPK